MAQYQVTVDSELLHQLFFRQDQGMAKLLEQVLNQCLSALQTEQIELAPVQWTPQGLGLDHDLKG